MDTEHWIAPFSDATGGNKAEEYLYLSTNKSTPFNVNIYNDNTLYKTVSISKGTPAVVSIPRNFIITTDKNDLFKTSKMGLHLVGDFKFYAHFRFSVQNHAEIVTSKGKAGLGNEFFVFTPKQTLPSTGLPNSMNATVGIIATENSTTIIISNFRDNLRLNNSTNEIVNSTTTKTITLNRGESYILEDLFSDNLSVPEGFLGLNIKSDKPISITNGCFNLLAPNGSNADVYMDQSSPIDRLGTEYISLNGNGEFYQNTTPTNMEVVYAVATEDNTSITVNGGSTINIPKKGDYYLFDATNYKLSTSTTVNGITYEGYHMYLKSDKNIYAYQLLAGNPTKTLPSGGMNILPSLRCLLPSNIEEFAKVDEIGTATGFNVRLNIIAQKNANVIVNGSNINGTYGPYPVTGTSEWESYMIPEVSGNISISTTNDKAITAGIAGGSGNVGYGGYFAGFSSNPIISKGGDCDNNNITLEVDDTYSTYQWFLNGQPYTGLGAQTYIITPTNSGYYTCEIYKANCNTTIITPAYKFQRCPFKSSKNYVIGDCETLQIPAPVFTTSTQIEDYSTLKETISPVNGTININNITGVITYTPKNLLANTDTFTVVLSGKDPTFPDMEYFTYNIDIKHLNTINVTINACKEASGEGKFNLTNAIVSNDTNITSVDYYTNYNATTDTYSGQITANFTQYPSVEKTVYAKVKNSFGCTKVAEIKLEFFPIPNLNTIAYNPTLCDVNFDNLYEVDFNKDVSPVVVSGYQNFDIYYSLTNNFSAPNRLPNNWSYSMPTKVYILVASKNGCTDATGFIDFKIGNKLPVNNITTPVCDNDRNGETEVIISNYVPSNYLYYDSLAKAKVGDVTKIISSQQTIKSDTTFYIRTVDATSCPNIFELQVQFIQPNVSTSLKDKVICKNTTTTVDAGPNFTHYKWSNNTEGDTAETAIYGVGDHYVDLSSNGCVYRQHFKISELIDPEIKVIDIQGNTVTVTVEGANPPYQYSIDGIHYQDSNVFENLQVGQYTLYVISKENCTPVMKDFTIMKLYNVITPNGDGLNDVLDYSALGTKSEVKFLVFDRDGKKVFEGNPGNSYTWDGTINGRKLVTSTYWYEIEWKEFGKTTPVKYTGWIFVKNF